MAWYVERDVDPQVRLTRIPRDAPIHPPREILVGADINVQAVGPVAAAPFVGRHVRLAVVPRIPRRTRVHDLDDDASVYCFVGRRAVRADVVDAVAGAAPYRCWGAGRRHVVGGWILAAVGCANAGIVLKVHVRLTTGAQACRDVFANVAGRGGEDASVVCGGRSVRVGAYCTSLSRVVVERCDSLHSYRRWLWLLRRPFGWQISRDSRQNA